MSEKKVSSGTVICLIIIFILIMCLAGMWYYYNHLKFVDNINNNDLKDKDIIQNEQEKEEQSELNEDTYIELDNELAMFIIENYLDLQGQMEGSFEGFLQHLKLVDEVKMNSEETIKDSEGIELWKTNIKYNDFKEKLLKYMSVSKFESFSYNHFANNEGYLYSLPGGATGYSFDIYDAQLKEQTDKGFVYIVKAVYLGPADEPGYEDIEAIIVKENGRYVLDSYKYLRSN